MIRSDTERGPQSALALLTLSATLWVVSIVPSAKRLLLGADYSERLYVSLEINFALVLLIAFYLVFKRRWVAFAGAGILALAWLYAMAVNSAV